tara:strand:+ start:239 stop:370 length:132 start_codon:yes stop_codon:yes gene_type:complete
MPMGKGTYGKTKGRPTVKSKPSKKSPTKLSNLKKMMMNSMKKK